MADSDSDVDSVASNDSDKELQIAFAQGLLKPGLNVGIQAPREAINDQEGMKIALDALKKDLSWVERMDITCDPASTHKALAIEQDLALSTTENDVHDDFKREMGFYRQAQAAVSLGFAKLKKLGIPTLRPNDYFAEMAKSDLHMKKVREKLLSKKLSMERSEKAKKMRELRKYGKKVQQDTLLRRQKEKREMMDAVKKFKKGKKSGLDFLDKAREEDGSAPHSKSGKSPGKPNQKRQHKNKKYGFGGQKKRSKYNTAESHKDFKKDFSAKKHSTRPGKVAGMKKQGNKNKPRPGKANRQKMKNRK